MEQNIAFALSIVAMSVSLAAWLRCQQVIAATEQRLNALRSNCFVTSERGHRIRYVNASPEVRARAESADDRLRLLIERIERLEEEKKGIADDISDVYSEAKSTGFDAKIMKQIIKLRAMKPDDRREMQAVLETYMAALGID